MTIALQVQVQLQYYKKRAAMPPFFRKDFMARKRISSQLTNLKTLNMYRRQMSTITQNRIYYKGLSENIFMPYVNRCLYRQGVVASFKDEILGHLILPFQNVGSLDVYGRPQRIQCYGLNGYRSKILTQEEFVLLYDTTGEYPIMFDIEQYAERMAADVRTMDINIAQQKTPRFITTSNENKMTTQNIINNIDSFENEVLAYDNNYIENFNVILSPAPYISDKVLEHKKEIWAEFLRFIGVANLSIQKKERLITDEISMSQGGTIVGRYNSAYPREVWKKELKDKLNIDVEWAFYDGLNTDLSKESDYCDISDI